MSAYLFENKGNKQFNELAGDEMKIIVDGIPNGLTYYCDGGSLGFPDIDIYAAYCVYANSDESKAVSK